MAAVHGARAFAINLSEVVNTLSMLAVPAVFGELPDGSWSRLQERLELLHSRLPSVTFADRDERLCGMPVAELMALLPELSECVAHASTSAERRARAALLSARFIAFMYVEPLFKAVRGGAVDDVRALLRAGASLDLRDPTSAGDAETPLHAAASSGHPAVVAVLLAEGADVNGRSACGSTALIRAATAGDLPSTQILLDAGADPSVRNDAGRTALGCVPANASALSELLIARDAEL
jgi:hypothetical protein